MSEVAGRGGCVVGNSYLCGCAADGRGRRWFQTSERGMFRYADGKAVVCDAVVVVLLLFVAVAARDQTNG